MSTQQGLIPKMFFLQFNRLLPLGVQHGDHHISWWSKKPPHLPTGGFCLSIFKINSPDAYPAIPESPNFPRFLLLVVLLHSSTLNPLN